MPRRYDKIINNRAKQDDSRPDWFSGLEGIVAETNAATMQIKVIIPAIDEDRVHDEWVDALVSWVGADGYGCFGLPEIGSEVILFSRLNEGYSLYYLSIYNESFKPPAEFAAGERGLKSDTIYKLLADLLVQIKSAEQVDVAGPLVRLMGGDGEVVRVTPGKIGFHGAGGSARRALPPAATDPPSCVPLVNAIRSFLIEVGLCS